MASRDFLVELGTEELPPKTLLQLAQTFGEQVSTALKQAELADTEAQVFATPRRLALLVTSVLERQPDKQVEQLGPPVAAAYDQQGEPTKAALGFARKCGVEVSDLQQIETDKGIKLGYRAQQTGATATQLLPGIVEKALDQLPIAKRMRWGNSRIEFVRPVHWLTMLLGDQVIDCEILGQRAGRDTYGHRFHYNQAINLKQPGEYNDTLMQTGFVIADFSSRREKIKAQIIEAAAKINAQPVIDEALLDEVTALVEWPVALLGQFDEEFLRVPEQALISSMQGHQKYFHLRDGNGKLLPNFITVSNIESTDAAQVIAGNERVIRPRLSDAAFFFDTDLTSSLESRLTALRSVIFQSKLGTLFDKSERIANLSASLAELVKGADIAMAKRAGLLSKGDLVSHMVNEFPELQGTMGYYYAGNDGEPEAVATAIREQYLPRHAGDRLPESHIGIVIAIADRLDTMVGLFAIGQPPSGVKDPFGIRRAALGVLRIIVEKQIDVDLYQCIELARKNFGRLADNSDLSNDVFEFMLERFRAWFQDEAIPTDVFQAVHARRPTRPLDFQKRIYAVHAFSRMTDAEALAAANKRVSNILSKQGIESDKREVSAHLLKEEAEKTLAQQVTQKITEIEPLIAQGDYTSALEGLAQLRPAIDAFFDQVMVMAEDSALRENRLALLQQLRGLFLEIADISLLQSS